MYRDLKIILILIIIAATSVVSYYVGHAYGIIESSNCKVEEFIT